MARNNRNLDSITREKGWWVGFYRLRWTHPYGLVLVGVENGPENAPISFEGFESHVEALRAAIIVKAQDAIIKRISEQNIGWKIVGARLDVRLKWVEIKLMLNLRKTEAVV